MGWYNSLYSVRLHLFKKKYSKSVCAEGALCVQDALQQRMTVQESAVLQLKQELLRTSMNRDELAGQNVSMLASVHVGV